MGMQPLPRDTGRMPDEGVEARNVEFVLDGYARFNAGEKEAGLWFFTPDAEYHVAREDPDSAVHRGIDAVRQQFARWVDTYPDLTVEPLEARASGDTVFLWVRFSGHGAGSGAPVEMELAHVLTMRDGKVARTVEYFDKAAALEAAGLSG
jgi:ketosteroid isomerase-like protein